MRRFQVQILTGIPNEDEMSANDNDRNVIELGPTVNMTVDECIAYAKRRSEDLQDVMVIGCDADGDVISVSSQMTRAEALWLVEYIKLNILGV